MLALRLGINALQSRLSRDEEGASAVEYGLLVGLIAVVIIGAVMAVGGSLSDMFNAVSGALDAIDIPGAGGGDE